MVTVYARSGCHLCDDLLADLRRLLPEHPGFVIEEIDIESDDNLFKAYLERIPVVMIGGDVVSELFIDRDRIERRMAALTTPGQIP